jgi:transposase InsO family protein
MSRIGKCYDNAMKKSFWSTLKRQAVGGHVFETIEEARVSTVRA